jgi:hypothetical protein
MPLPYPSTTLKRLYGFIPKPKDHFHNRFSITRNFGAASLDLPARFSVEDAKGDINGPRQQFNNFCSAATQSEIGADEFGIPMSQKFAALAISQIIKQPLYIAGASIDDSMKAGTTYGYLPLAQEPDNIKELQPFQNAEPTICEISNWPADIFAKALKYIISGGHFYIDGPYDAFDNFRSQIYQHRPDNGISCGVPWYSIFNRTPSTGIVRAPGGTVAAWHDVDMKGWETINGALYIVIRSWDLNEGKDTYFYFSRAAWNAIMAVPGAVGKMFKNADESLVNDLKQRRLSISEQIMNLYYQISFKLSQLTH